MNEENLWKTRIVLQSVAIFVAISIFLGRIYFLSFHERLGLPVTDVPINIMDYSIISPNVTLFCFTISIISGIIFMFPEQTKQMVTRVKLKYEAGVLLWPLSMMSAIYIDDVYRAIGPEFPFIYGFQMSLILVLSALSGAFLAAHEDQRQSELKARQSDVTMDNSADGEADASSNWFLKRLRIVVVKCKIIVSKRKRNVLDFGQIVRSLLPVIIILSIIGMLPWSASQVASNDAIITYETAPTAHVKLTNEQIGFMDQQRDHECEMCSNILHVGVVAMGERFIYVREFESDIFDDDAEILAIPIDDVEYLKFDPLPYSRQD